MKTNLMKSFAELESVVLASKQLVVEISAAAECCASCIVNGGTIFTCGNGGSAADAMHFAEELSGRYKNTRRALSGLCLNADPSAITCIANDFGFESLFSRQLEAYGKAGDLLVLFSSSGNSINQINAIHKAKELGIGTLLLCGKDGGKCKGLADVEVIIPSQNGARVQEMHGFLLHAIIEEIEASI